MADSRILDMVPPPWRNHPLLRGIANAVGRRFDYWRTLIQSLPSMFSAEGAPSAWLDWLMMVVGHLQRRGLSDRRKRNLIEKAGEIWRKKGTPEGIELYLQALVGLDAQVVEENTHAFIAGISLAGDICGPGVNAQRYQLERPADTDLTDAELRELLKPVVPKMRQYRICDLNGENCTTYKYPET